MVKRSRLRLLKAWLLTVLVIGVVAFSGTGGTLASFNASTLNADNTLSSGTLTLDDWVTSGTICLSSGGVVGSASTNENSDCTAVLSVTNVAPGSWSTSSQSAKVTVEDSGSLAASTFTLGAPTGATCVGSKTATSPHITVTAVTLTTGHDTATASAGSFSKVQVGMPVLAKGVPAGTTVTGVSSTTVTMSKSATTSGSESVSFGWSTTVAGVEFTSGQKTVAVASGGFPGVSVGMTVSVKAPEPMPVSTGTVVTAVNGTKLTLSRAATATVTETANFGATSGKQDNFTATPTTTSHPFCSAATMSVQESATVTGHTDYFCWYGYGVTLTTSPTESATKGLCLEPLSTTLATSISCASGITSIRLSSVTGPVFKTDLLTVVSGGKTCQLTATTTTRTTPVLASTSPTTVSVAYHAGTGSFPAGAAVSNSTVSTDMNADHTHTIKNFLSKYAQPHEGITLYPVTGPGTVSETAPVELEPLESRTFTIGLYLPKTVASQNKLQGLSTSFGLTWYISQ